MSQIGKNATLDPSKMVRRAASETSGGLSSRTTTEPASTGQRSTIEAVPRTARPPLTSDQVLALINTGASLQWTDDFLAARPARAQANRTLVGRAAQIRARANEKGGQVMTPPELIETLVCDVVADIQRLMKEHLSRIHASTHIRDTRPDAQERGQMCKEAAIGLLHSRGLSGLEAVLPTLFTRHQKDERVDRFELRGDTTSVQKHITRQLVEAGVIQPGEPVRLGQQGDRTLTYDGVDFRVRTSFVADARLTPADIAPYAPHAFGDHAPALLQQAALTATPEQLAALPPRWLIDPKITEAWLDAATVNDLKAWMSTPNAIEAFSASTGNAQADRIDQLRAAGISIADMARTGFMALDPASILKLCNWMDRGRAADVRELLKLPGARAALAAAFEECALSGDVRHARTLIDFMPRTQAGDLAVPPGASSSSKPLLHRVIEHCVIDLLERNVLQMLIDKGLPWGPAEDQCAAQCGFSTKEILELAGQRSHIDFGPQVKRLIADTRPSVWTSKILGDTQAIGPLPDAVKQFHRGAIATASRQVAMESFEPAQQERATHKLMDRLAPNFGLHGPANDATVGLLVISDETLSACRERVAASTTPAQFIDRVALDIAGKVEDSYRAALAMKAGPAASTEGLSAKEAHAAWQRCLNGQHGAYHMPNASSLPWQSLFDRREDPDGDPAKALYTLKLGGAAPMALQIHVRDALAAQKLIKVEETLLHKRGERQVMYDGHRAYVKESATTDPEQSPSIEPLSVADLLSFPSLEVFGGSAAGLIEEAIRNSAPLALAAIPQAWLKGDRALLAWLDRAAKPDVQAWMASAGGRRFDRADPPLKAKVLAALLRRGVKLDALVSAGLLDVKKVPNALVSHLILEGCGGTVMDLLANHGVGHRVRIHSRAENWRDEPMPCALLMADERLMAALDKARFRSVDLAIALPGEHPTFINTLIDAGNPAALKLLLAQKAHPDEQRMLQCLAHNGNADLCRLLLQARAFKPREVSSALSAAVRGGRVPIARMLADSMSATSEGQAALGDWLEKAPFAVGNRKLSCMQYARHTNNQEMVGFLKELTNRP